MPSPGTLAGASGGGYGGFALKVLAQEMARLEVPEPVLGLRWH